MSEPKLTPLEYGIARYLEHELAAELERLADDWHAEAAQIKSSPCFNDYDEYTTDEITARVAALRKRAAELKGDEA